HNQEILTQLLQRLDARVDNLSRSQAALEEATLAARRGQELLLDLMLQANRTQERLAQLLANQEQRLNQHDETLVQLAETIQEIRSYIRFARENGHPNGG
ncbi:MAG: hypothetical protein SNJ68_11035, partial [Cyanobacteriota bacterium]